MRERERESTCEWRKRKTEDKKEQMEGTKNEKVRRGQKYIKKHGIN